MSHKFDAPQRIVGGSPVCTCCNTVVAVGAKKITVDEHVLHDDCSEKLDIVTMIKNDLKPIIAALPETLFKGTQILERLERAYTISAFKSAWHSLCEHLASAKRWLNGQFHDAVAALKRIIEGSKIKNVLTPAMNF